MAIDPTKFSRQTLADIEKLTELLNKVQKSGNPTDEDIRITGILVDRAPLHVRPYCKAVYQDMLEKLGKI